jgi:prevent-host-death family protein
MAIRERTVPSTKLKAGLSAVLDHVLRGEHIHVERHGRPVGTLVPAEQYAAWREHMGATADER